MPNAYGNTHLDFIACRMLGGGTLVKVSGQGINNVAVVKVHTRYCRPGITHSPCDGSPTFIPLNGRSRACRIVQVSRKGYCLPGRHGGGWRNVDAYGWITIVDNI